MKDKIKVFDEIELELPAPSYAKMSTYEKKHAILERLQMLGCDPIEGMARVAMKAEAGFQKWDKDGNEIFVQDYALAGQMYKELANYVAPKRKATDYNETETKDVSNHMTITIEPM